MWVMSIIGIVWFSLSLIFILAFMDTDVDAAMGWGMLGMLYAIPYAIVGIVTTKKKSKDDSTSMQQLINLNELKEKGILTDDEFQFKKQQILG
ncbi:SHOCT domain-containing protein [Rheinheimera salexigens]|uniref:SHOCT domain-containing protein n=1 Tax=Rheinheimera salexigens TaxID=1628148 RepID=A0A1E7Q3W8_9GAMM|nr:SHOCT domain-containing protein [Rheinheimera salexigens]OEY68773.1 hypothetical protein BI198_03735 [Rheinheimera salexigens]